MKPRFRLVSDGQLRQWLAALEMCPTLVPFVVDLRIAARNEIWRRDSASERESAWMLASLDGWQ